MSAITPILDTLLPQVLGRRADLERLATLFPNAPLGRVRRAGESLPLDTRLPNPTNVQRGGESARASATTAGNASVQASAAQAGRSATGVTTRGHAATSSGASAALAASTSTALHLTRAGDVLASVLARFATAPLVRSTRNAPLVDGGSRPAPAVLAALLAGEVGQSGVFYESHLLQWLRGQYPASALAREPQSRYHALGLLADSTDNTGSDQTRPDRRAGQGSRLAGSTDNRLSAVVRQQMEVLSTGAFQWQGEVWPGVVLDWEIRETPDSTSDNGAESPAADQAADYTTSMRLVLPSLGEIEIRIAMHDQDVVVHAHAADDIARRLIGRDANTLRKRLREAGFKQAEVSLLASGQKSSI
ncbi:MAG: flagellar hook-length control protein FliK [Salinisphaera sp.]|jgi:hypothetical protein|nr:flagellar hook-length control protein FliK [Salinisphaera sp.]